MANMTLFSQLLKQLDRGLFYKSVREYQTDKYSKGINSWTHLVSMIFSNITKAQSIRVITNGLLSASGNVNHFGIIGKLPSKSSLSYINANRDWWMFRDYYLRLYEHFQQVGNFKRYLNTTI